MESFGDFYLIFCLISCWERGSLGRERPDGMKSVSTYSSLALISHVLTRAGNKPHMGKKLKAPWGIGRSFATEVMATVGGGASCEDGRGNCTTVEVSGRVRIPESQASWNEAGAGLETKETTQEVRAGATGGRESGREAGWATVLSSSGPHDLHVPTYKAGHKLKQ